jgi:hypothetical protein
MVVSLTDYRLLIRELRKIDRELPKQIKRDYKEIGKPMQKAIRSAIPNTAPLGPRKNPKLGGMTPGMQHMGRTAWGSGATLGGGGKRKPAKSVSVQTPARKRDSARKFSILRLRVNSAATGMADMAGRSGTSVNKYPRTRLYSIRLFGKDIVTRSHRINGQGKALISNLATARGKVKGNASRYAWPTAEKKLPAAKIEVGKVLDRYTRIVNLKMRAK